MKTRFLLGAAGLAGATVILGQMNVGASDLKSSDPGTALGGDVTGQSSRGVVGPDVIVGDLHQVRTWISGETETVYTMGTTSCNIGDEPLDWDGQPSHDHPVISQNMFQLVDGRFEQVGQAWLKHSFCALQRFICGDCEGGPGCLDQLFPMCSDPYSASRNGGQTGLGPKWEVNAHTGDFVLPWAQGEGTGGEYRRRVRVANTVLDRGGDFFIEGGYVAKDDAAVGNANNNYSFRKIDIGPAGSGYQMSFIEGEGTHREESAMYAWQQFAEDEVTIREVQVDADGNPDEQGMYDDGLFLVGYSARFEDGLWYYEYAVQNQNSHRSARTFTVNVPDDAFVAEIGFHDVAYHSGDGINGVNYDGTDWEAVRENNTITWSTQTFEENENANALRWGTMYNFRFLSTSPPGDRRATLGLYRPGTPDAMVTTTMVPVLCAADFSSDGMVGFEDLVYVLSVWGQEDVPEDIDGSGTVDWGDILEILAAWGDC